MTEKHKLLALIHFLRGTGAKHVQLRYSDEQQPDIWIVVAKFDGKNRYDIDGVEVEASFTPVRAALRLCERLVDGRKCRYCGKRIALEMDSLAKLPFDHMICWYQYDPELKTIRRGCE